MLKVLLQTRFERVWHLVKAYELANSHQLRVVPCGAGVEPLNDRRNITEDRGVHQGWLREWSMVGGNGRMEVNLV